MKKHFPSGITAYCRLFLKLGSGLFLLFFMCFAPIAPAITQVGSAVFLFLLIILSPFAPDKSHKTETPLPEAAQNIYCQIENDSPEQQLDQLQQSQEQNLYRQTILAAEKNFAKKPPEIQRFSSGIFVYDLQKPENWQSSCLPVRAGPTVPAV